MLVALSEFDTEDPEKSHRVHRGPDTRVWKSTTEGRQISLWFSVILCVLCVELFRI
jgi:hypothetical protein